MKPRLAVSLGDPLGIGPEIVARALEDPALPELAEIQIHGDRSLLSAPFVARCDEAEAARQASGALASGVDAVLAGEADALVTAPLHKASLAGLPDGPFMGHTGYLAHRCQGDPLMSFVAGELRVALLTVHIPLAEVPRQLQALGPQGIARRIRLYATGLRDDLGITSPRLALLGLNPHAGEAGMIGSEEIELFEPALAELRSEGLDIDGPLSADGYFGELSRRGPLHHGIVGCAHDQALIGYKALATASGVQVSLGLPIVRTSVQHGTARDLAGQGRADFSSMLAALKLAAEIVQRRRQRTSSGPIGAGAL